MRKSTDKPIQIKKKFEENSENTNENAFESEKILENDKSSDNDEINVNQVENFEKNQNDFKEIIQNENISVKKEIFSERKKSSLEDLKRIEFLLKLF